MTLIYIDQKSGGKLFQAGKDEISNLLKTNKISILIFAAQEFQPKHPRIRDPQFQTLLNKPQKIFVPLDDSNYMPAEHLIAVKKIAIYAANAIKNGQSVLSTCHKGWNRSGIISGFTLKYLTGCSGQQAIKQIKRNRGLIALSNSYFQNLLI